MANLRKIARRKAKKYGLDPNVFERQIGAESGFNPRAVSPAGARGAAQIMPATAAAWGVNPDHPREALDASAKHMAEYVKQFGSYRNALIAYNAGPGNVGKALPAETQGYIQKILGGKEPNVKGVGGTSGGTTMTLRTPGAMKIDDKAAAIDALLQHARNPKSSLLQLFSDNIDSGQYTSQQPAETQSSTIPGTHIQLPGGGKGAPPGHPAHGGYPLGARGKVIGIPHEGTHTLGNWQSDNAVDISIPVGTPVYASGNGIVTRAGLLPGEGKSGGGRFAGYRVQLEGKGNSFWYGHLSRLSVKTGAHVRKGQLLGYSGEANGTPHLHYAVEHGDPRHITGK